MADRERRQRKHVQRLGNYADDEALGELDLESESEGEGSDVEEARGAVAKAARRGGGRRGAPPKTAVTADMLSTLLAGAPALVDYLLLEDSVRSITLCCRDVVNLNIAAGGGVNLEPVWQALASHIKAKAATAAAAAAEQAAAAAEDAVAEGPAAPAPPAAPAAPAPAPAPEPEPAGRRGPRGRAKKAKLPAKPPALDLVKAAVAADPACSGDVRKTSAPWEYRISQKSVAALPAHKGERGKTLYCRELDIRALAWQRWGDQAGMEAAKKRVAELERQRRELYAQQQKQEREARQEELAIRLAENGLPPDTAQVQANYQLRDWVQYGGYYWQSLDQVLAPIIERHRQQLEAAEQARLRRERTQLLDDSLEAEGLQFFRRDWRYRCFISCGEPDGLQALLGTARRQLAARLSEGERYRELAERLDAAGLEHYHSTSPMFAAWLKTGKGDIEAIVQQRRLRVDRECQLQYLLEMNGLLHRQNSERCNKFITGELLHRSGVPYTAKEVVSSLLASLGSEHTRCQELLDRLRDERLPPVMHLSWCQTFVAIGGDLDAVIYQVKEYVHSRVNVGVPPPGRPWAAADISTGAQIGARAAAPPASLPVRLRLLQDGHPMPVATEVQLETGQQLVTFMRSVPPGSSVSSLTAQLLDGSGEPAAAVVVGKLSVTWQDGSMDVTWDAPSATYSEAASAIRLPAIQAPSKPGMRYETVRFISSNPPLSFSLGLYVQAELPTLPSYLEAATDQAAEHEQAAPEEAEGSQQGLQGDEDWLEAAAEAAAEVAEGLEEEEADHYAAEAADEADGLADGNAQDSSERSDGTGGVAAAAAGSERDAAPAQLASEGAAAEGVAAEGDGVADAGGAAGLADAEVASGPGADATAAAGQEPAATSDEEQGTVEKMAVDTAGEQPAAGGETSFFSADEAVAATAAKTAGQQQEGGQPEQGQQDEMSVPMQE